MTLGARCAAVPPEALFICPGRTCGFAAEIFVGLTEPDPRRATDRPGWDSARAVWWTWLLVTRC